MIAFVLAISAMILPILVLSKNLVVDEFTNLLLNDERDWTINGVLPSFVAADSVNFSLYL